MYIGLHVKCLLCLLDFTETCILLTDFRKNTQISYFMKIHTVGGERTDRHEATVECAILRTRLNTHRPTTIVFHSYDV
jgi:hypothetical protein